jgi:hypothetical protein
LSDDSSLHKFSQFGEAIFHESSLRELSTSLDSFRQEILDHFFATILSGSFPRPEYGLWKPLSIDRSLIREESVKLADALFAAVELNKAAALQELLHDVKDINMRHEETGLGLLHKAAASGHAPPPLLWE